MLKLCLLVRIRIQIKAMHSTLLICLLNLFKSINPHLIVFFLFEIFLVLLLLLKKLGHLSFKISHGLYFIDFTSVMSIDWFRFNMSDILHHRWRFYVFCVFFFFGFFLFVFYLGCLENEDCKNPSQHTNYSQLAYLDFQWVHAGNFRSIRCPLILPTLSIED